MAILPAWINIVVVLLHVTVIQGAGEPEFAASVPANVLATYDGTPGSSSVTLPCTLSFTDPQIDPQNMEWRVDLTWFKREFGETQTTNLYIWENNYDDRIDMNETRISRVNGPFEERYNMRFNYVRAEDEGEYCCYLHINTNPSDTACTNLHYKAFQDDDAHFIMDCDATDADPMTTTVNCPAVGSSIPPMNVQIKNFYPNIIQSEGRMVELYAPAKDSANAINTVASTDFINNTDGTFNVNFNSSWPAEYECDTLGAVTFLISLTHKLEGDETHHTCTWIPHVTTTTGRGKTLDPESDGGEMGKNTGLKLGLGLGLGLGIPLALILIAAAVWFYQRKAKKNITSSQAERRPTSQTELAGLNQDGRAANGHYPPAKA